MGVNSLQSLIRDLVPEHHPETCWKRTSSDCTPDLRNQETLRNGVQQPEAKTLMVVLLTHVGTVNGWSRTWRTWHRTQCMAHDGQQHHCHLPGATRIYGSFSWSSEPRGMTVLVEGGTWNKI